MSKSFNSNGIMELIFQFNEHVTIKRIKESYFQIISDVCPVPFGDVKKEIMNLDVQKSFSSESVPATILRQ